MSRFARNTPIVCLAGKPPRPGTILDVLISRLSSEGYAITIELPHESGGGWIDRWQDGTLIVHRGLMRPVLSDLAKHEQRGVRFCNRIAGCLDAQDRPTLMRRLQSAGLPVSVFECHELWSEVRASAAGCDVVIKAADGGIGRGARVLFASEGQLPPEPPFVGPYVIEQRIVSDGTDRKLYIAGSKCFGLLKPWPRTSASADVWFEPTEDLRALAFATGLAVGLEIYGVDIVIGPEGPVIVDVNVFPGFRGIAGGAEAVADHIMRAACEAAPD